MHIGNQIGPFVYSDAAPLIRVKKGKVPYIIGVATAYNARGLIGPEANGVFVLNDEAKAVVTDQIEKQQSGYYGPSAAQIAEQKRIAALPAKQFRSFIEGTKRFRGML